MGKEQPGITRACFKKSVSLRPSLDLSRELSSHWNPSLSLSSATITENGRILITVVAGRCVSTFLCAGFSRCGNGYVKLVCMLRSKGYIPAGARVKRLLVDKGFVNVRAEWNEVFSAGERIIAVSYTHLTLPTTPYV
eukprot:TRINITY_DN2378_c0_g2_i10.p1 TRINITY_DN2378_c0_g2~~TRINITY_DN2378_c0_g2_i10.p1  ORF type:complete len:137 (-),score=29.64 TRINITY_DN2378_c0_g2_i10:47-457(-)